MKDTIEETVADHEGANYCIKSYTFAERQAMRMARYPKTHFWVVFFISLVISFIAFTKSGIDFAADDSGWLSRGSLIANRQTQLLVVMLNKDDLFYGGTDAWDELINNEQGNWQVPGEDPRNSEENKDNRRRLNAIPVTVTSTNTSSSFSSKFVQNLFPTAKSQQSLLFPNKDDGLRELEYGNLSSHHQKITELLIRRLQENQDSTDGDNGFFRCDWGWYTDGRMNRRRNLWPVWHTASTALDSDVIRDICHAEENTQRVLEENGFCYGCTDGCLPPYSLVFYLRLLIADGMSMDCDELADTWSESIQKQDEIEGNLEICVSDINENNDIDQLPKSCGAFFFPSLLDEFFVDTGVVQYTSSIFATKKSSIEDMYEMVESFDKGTVRVEGAYDTRGQHFLDLLSESSVTSDMSLALGSAIITALAILVHTRSPFLTLVGLIQIMFSLPLSIFVYKFLGGLDFFPFLNFIGVFVVFALGADHVFVAVDKWKNARIKYPHATTEEIAAKALPDAAGAMLLTTSTTAIAFFGTAICPVAPIKLFAIFCGLLITFDYVMDILLLFPCLIIYDNYRTKQNCCMSCHCCHSLEAEDNDSETFLPDDTKKAKCPENEERSPEHENEKDSENSEIEATENDVEKVHNHVIQSEDDTEKEEHVDKKPSLIQRILLGYYHLLHKGRWPLFALSIISLILCCFFATTLQMPTTSDVRIVGEHIEYEKSYQWRRNLLNEAVRRRGGSQAFISWGTVPADTGDLNDPNKWTTLVLDDAFDPSTVSAQRHLVQFCESIFEQDFASRIHPIYECPIIRFDQWIQQQYKATAKDEIYKSNCDGASALPMSPSAFHSCMIGWAYKEKEMYGELIPDAVLAKDGRVRVIYFPFNSRVRYDSPNDELDNEWHLIEDWMNDMHAKAPSEVSNAFFSSSDFWWYDTNLQMFNTAYGAAGIAIAAAALVILFSSRSFILTLFSVLSIAYVLTSVISLMAAIGWTLGFLESVCFAILIGVSVDFVIHFSHAYASMSHSPDEANIDRSERTKFALLHMGPSILAAAFTTLAGATIMLFTTITFFQKFAMILFVTIMQATAGSFIVFLALTDTIGPSNPTYLMDRAAEKIAEFKRQLQDQS